MKAYFFFFFLTLLTCPSNAVSAQTIVGKWHSVDPDDQKETTIELYLKEGKLFGKIVALLQDEDKNKTCRKCPNEFKDKPLLGLEILRGFSLENNIWTKGVILVPKTGKEYKCNISIDDKQRLVIRGYIGFSLLGRSTYWYRAKE